MLLHNGCVKMAMKCINQSQRLSTVYVHNGAWEIASFPSKLHYKRSAFSFLSWTPIIKVVVEWAKTCTETFLHALHMIYIETREWQWGAHCEISFGLIIIMFLWWWDDMCTWIQWSCDHHKYIVSFVSDPFPPLFLLWPLQFFPVLHFLSSYQNYGFSLFSSIC